ncbi:MAG: hypothetical protein IJT03_04745 [Clostridia bacterium]|nr:hypothetical protein [Clostridia bacterium]
MKSKTSKVMTGVGVGMLVGGATALLGGKMMGDKSSGYKKLAKKAVKTVEDFIDGMS